jgi:hypothetical protein
MNRLKILIIAVILISCTGEKVKATDPIGTPHYNLSNKDELSFCGEKAPLNDRDVLERAEREMILLMQQQGQIVLYMKRAGKYFPQIEKILKEQNAPDDLKYLAVAESALFMSKSSKDALGFWQFMEGTAKSHGLRVDDYVDERKNVELSTLAAINYLKSGYNQYKSWTMAAAGYNMGYNGLQNAVSMQNTQNYYELYLNEETSRYIFRILIIKDILSNPRKYGIDLSKVVTYKPEQTRKVKVNHSIDNVAEWAKKNKSNYKQVKNLNPWILKNVLNEPKGRAYEILLPE